MEPPPFRLNRAHLSVRGGARRIRFGRDTSFLVAGHRRHVLARLFMPFCLRYIESNFMKLLGAAIVFLPLIFAQRSSLTPRGAASCADDRLAVEILSPTALALLTVGRTIPVEAKIADACGNPVLTPGPGNRSAATMIFGNGDPSIDLDAVGNGVWRGTWTPTKTTPSGLFRVEVSSIVEITASRIQTGRAEVTVAMPSESGPFLTVSDTSAKLRARQGNGTVTTTIDVTNSGLIPVPYTLSVQTHSGGPWLSGSPVAGTFAPGTVTRMLAIATTDGLAPGVYSATVFATFFGITVPYPVYLTITGDRARILLSQTGLTFTAVQDGGGTTPDRFGVLNEGGGEMRFEARATTLSGGQWLKLANASNRVTRPLQDVAYVDVTADASRLEPGTYYGNIQVTSADADSPKSVTAVLRVLPKGSNPGPELRPTGLVFTGAVNTSPPAQEIRINNLLSDRISYASTSITDDRTNWLAYTPPDGAVQPGTPQVLSVRPDFSKTPAGIKRGVVTLLFSDGGSVRNINVLSVIPPASTVAAKNGTKSASSCLLDALQLQWILPREDSTVILGQPVPVELKIVDSCGNPLVANEQGATAQVKLKFSDNQAVRTLTHVGNGVWAGTWTPGGTIGPVLATAVAINAINLRVQAGQRPIRLEVAGSQTPIIRPGALVHAASLLGDAPVAPGTLVTIYGTNLSEGAAGTTAAPLPTDLRGTRVELGGKPLPLLFASSGQVNAQIPFDLSLETEHQVVVRRGDTQSVAESFAVTAVRPGIFAVNQQGTGQGVVLGPDQMTIADANAPAIRGQLVVIYCTGLGAVNPPIEAGAPAPSLPITRTANLVTVAVGGKPAQVIFAGLSPGYAGLYQINCILAQDTPVGDAIPVIVSTPQQASNTVTIAVR